MIPCCRWASVEFVSIRETNFAISSSPSHHSQHPSYCWDMDLKRRGRKKPWMATGRGRTDRNTEGEIKKPFLNVEASQSNALYSTAQWLATRDAVLYRDPLCQWCLPCGLAVEATEADHIIPSSQATSHAEFFDQENIVGSCRSCNTRRASYTAKGVYYETKKEWQDFLRRKFFRKQTRT